ncbi:MAG: hypothetical protein JRH20_30865 [Deltaproteobacteria bacterium]|nr:hypothetical protein [Deltaproteobacteria bacterium]
MNSRHSKVAISAWIAIWLLASAPASAMHPPKPGERYNRTGPTFGVGGLWADTFKDYGEGTAGFGYWIEAGYRLTEPAMGCVSANLGITHTFNEEPGERFTIYADMSLAGWSVGPLVVRQDGLTRFGAFFGLNMPMFRFDVDGWRGGKNERLRGATFVQLRADLVVDGPDVFTVGVMFKLDFLEFYKVWPPPGYTRPSSLPSKTACPTSCPASCPATQPASCPATRPTTQPTVNAGENSAPSSRPDLRLWRPLP